MPKFDKIFEYGSQNANYIDSENYLNRLLMIRKHYYTVSKFSPILTNRLVSNNNSILNNTSFKLMTDNFKYFILINNFNIFFKLNSFKVHENSTFNNIESGINKYGRNFFKLNFLESSLSENYSNLADILVRREFIYRSFLIGYNLKPNLPKSLISNTNNFFLSELKANSLTNEYRLLNNVFSDLPILKNQYKPMRRGISNMIRIQASNIISLPVELRIQVLASSRDIIHSWAIPSAGVKIDCIPGYSSHKILFFLLSGIY
jgi:heme/copper-type cytochrome/quinol oxidase subunit 2